MIVPPCFDLRPHVLLVMPSLLCVCTFILTDITETESLQYGVYTNITGILKGKLAHDFNDKTFISNYHIVLFGD